MHRRTLVLALAPVLVLCAWSPAAAQDLTGWIYQRIAMLSATGGAASAKQVETPSVATNSSSLVERSGAPDLIGLATQLFNQGRSGDATPTAMTISAFAVRAALLGTDPMRPEVYAAGRAWRRYSAVFGREAATSDGLPEAQIFGAKALLWDQRDPTSPSNVKLLRATQRSDVGTQFSVAMGALNTLIGGLLGPRLGLDPFDVLKQRLGPDRQAETLAMLTADDLETIDALLRERFVPILAQAQEEQRQLVQQLLRAPQLAVSYQAKLRDDIGNEHQWLAVFDYGVADRIELSVNGGVFVVDRPHVKSRASGRLALQGQFRITGGGSSLAGILRPQAPVVVSVSAASSWEPDTEDIHKFQAKITIPLPGPLSGLALPISLTVANRTELIDERDVRGQVGLTFDFARLTSAFRASR